MGKQFEDITPNLAEWLGQRHMFFVARYCLLRLPQRPTSQLRMCGVVLLVIGVALIRIV